MDNYLFVRLQICIDFYIAKAKTYRHVLELNNQ